VPFAIQIGICHSGRMTQFERLNSQPLNAPRVIDPVARKTSDFKSPTRSGDILSNEKTALAIRRVVHTELQACATAIARKDQKAALDQLSEASARLKRLASELIRQFG
jgi:hypothetical protein